MHRRPCCLKTTDNYHQTALDEYNFLKEKKIEEKKKEKWNVSIIWCYIHGERLVAIKTGNVNDSVRRMALPSPIPPAPTKSIIFTSFLVSVICWQFPFNFAFFLFSRKLYFEDNDSLAINQKDLKKKSIEKKNK